jgi:iron(III) transport system substrate-binding protein
MKRMILLNCTVSALAVTLAACGTDADSGAGGDKGGGDEVQAVYDDYVKEGMPGVEVDLVRAAAEEGKVVFYTSTNLASNAVAEAFRKRFPFIAVEQLQLAGGTLTERFAAEQAAGTHAADVLNTSSEPDVRAFAEKGYCEKYTPSTDSRFSAGDKVPGMVYRWNGTVQGIAYLADSLKPEQVASLDTWDTLTSDVWNGAVFGWIDAAAGGTTVFVNTYFYNEHGTDLWKEHKGLVEKVNVYGGTNPTTQALLQGEIDVTGPVGISAPYEMFSEGAPVRWASPKPTLAVPAAGCVAAKPPHPNAAKLLWSYVLSDEGQAAIAPYGSVSYLKDFKAPKIKDLEGEDWYKSPDAASVVNIPEEQLSKSRETVINEWRAIFGKAAKK